MSLYRDYLESAFVVGNGVNKPLLGGQAAAALAPRVVYAQVDSFPDPGDPTQTCFRFYFEGDPLSSPEEAAFDAVVAAHDGSAMVVTGVEVVAVANIINKSVIDQTDWQLIGGVVTEPAFYGDLANIAARITGFAQGIGSGDTLSLRVVEHAAGDPAEETVLSATHDIMDTDPPVFLFDTNQSASAGLNVYRVEGRVSDALKPVTLEMCSMAMLRLTYAGG